MTWSCLAGGYNFGGKEPRCQHIHSLNRTCFTVPKCTCTIRHQLQHYTCATQQLIHILSNTAFHCTQWHIDYQRRTAMTIASQMPNKLHVLTHHVTLISCPLRALQTTFITKNKYLTLAFVSQLDASRQLHARSDTFLQRSLVVKLGVSPSRSRLLTRSHSLSSGDSTRSLQAAELRLSLTPSQVTVYGLAYRNGNPRTALC
jgi:hypothetical protein